MTSDEQAIRNLIEQWHRATAAGDVETVVSLMTEEAIFLRAGGSPMAGRAAFEATLRKVLEDHRIRSSAKVEDVLVSGDLAVARSKLQVSIEKKSGGVATDRAGYALSVFRRQASGRWALVQDANLLPPPS